MKISLLISTYNWPESLELILLSILDQTRMPDEVIIADDGSRQETADLISRYANDFPVPIIHVWHEDDGFRLSVIRNKAIAKAKFEYIVQIDGDMILHPRFIEDHEKLAEKGCFISGSRVLVGKDLTKDITRLKRYKFSPFSKGITNRLNAIHFPFINNFIKSKNSPIEYLMYRIRGGNMSFWRQDLIDINGYDESFIGWGREDSELVIRLFKKGLKLKRIKLCAILFHLHHKENDRSNFDKNHEIMLESIAAKGFRAKNGIDKSGF